VNGVSAVVLVFGHRYESAVIRLIVPVCIYAIKGQMVRISIRKRPCRKVYEGSPAFADLNASGSVVVPLIIVWVRASLDHKAPPSVKRSAVHAVSFVRARLASVGPSISQVCRVYAKLATALAFAKVAKGMVHVDRFPDNRPKTYIGPKRKSLMLHHFHSTMSVLASGGFQ